MIFCFCLFLVSSIYVTVSVQRSARAGSERLHNAAYSLLKFVVFQMICMVPIGIDLQFSTRTARISVQDDAVGLLLFDALSNAFETCLTVFQIIQVYIMFTRLERNAAPPMLSNESGMCSSQLQLTSMPSAMLNSSKSDLPPEFLSRSHGSRVGSDTSLSNVSSGQSSAALLTPRLESHLASLAENPDSPAPGASGRKPQRSSPSKFELHR